MIRNTKEDPREPSRRPQNLSFIFFKVPTNLVAQATQSKAPSKCRPSISPEPGRTLLLDGIVDRAAGGLYRPVTIPVTDRNAGYDGDVRLSTSCMLEHDDHELVARPRALYRGFLNVMTQAR